MAKRSPKTNAPKVGKKVVKLAGQMLKKGNKKERSLAGEVLRQKRG